MSDLAPPEFSENILPALEGGEDWQDAMMLLAQDEGYFQSLDEQNYVFFIEAGPKLLVCFDTVEDIAKKSDTLPSQYHLAQKEGWSFLAIITEGADHWRSDGVFAHFDALSDDDFFDAFETVLFYAAGAECHAAARYVAAAPGALALLLAPQVCAPAKGERFAKAEEMIEAAAKLWVIHDPARYNETKEAQFLSQDWVEMIAMHHSFGRAESFLQDSDILDTLLKDAMSGQVTALTFYRLWRKRRSQPSYLRTILRHAYSNNRLMHEFMICRSVSRRIQMPRINERMKHLRRIPQLQHLGA